MVKKKKKKNLIKLQQWSRVADDFSFLPLSSSAAKKAARQSSRVTMGPQNQVGIQETTNLFIQRETVLKTPTDSDTGPREVAAVNANIIRVKKELSCLSRVVISNI